MNLLKADHANCDECGQLRKGVRFIIGIVSKRESFLCWDHFVLALQAMGKAGLLVPRIARPADRCPRCQRENCHNWLDRDKEDRNVCCSCVCCTGSETWSGSLDKTGANPKGWSHAETSSESDTEGRSRRHTKGCGGSETSSD